MQFSRTSINQRYFISKTYLNYRFTGGQKIFRAPNDIFTLYEAAIRQVHDAYTEPKFVMNLA